MSEENIFSGETPAPVADQPDGNIQETTTSTIPDPVSKYVGEGKKYATVDAYYQAFDNAQEHIQKLENENAEYREQVSTMGTVEEALQKLTSTEVSQQEVAPQAFDPNVLDQLIESKLSAKEQQVVAQSNIKEVVNEMTNFYGDQAKAEEAYIKLAQDTGISVNFLNDMASRSPAAVLKLAGLNSKPAPSMPLDSSVNTEALRQSVQSTTPSSKVPLGANTKDMVNAWRAAGEAIKNQ